MPSVSTCQTCGIEITPRTSGGKPQVRCSRACRVKATQQKSRAIARARRSTRCPECTSTFQQPEFGRPRKFCSDQCKQRVGNRAQNRRRLPAPKQPDRQCACGAVFAPRRRDQICCTPTCARSQSQKRRYNGGERRQGAAFPATCLECATDFIAKKAGTRWCSVRCRNRAARREASRRRGSNEGSVPYVDRDIFERDGWKCHLCKKPVDPTTPRTDPGGATIDHIIPRSLGGVDAPANVATSHWLCNRSKGVRPMNEQLALI